MENRGENKFPFKKISLKLLWFFPIVVLSVVLIWIILLLNSFVFLLIGNGLVYNYVLSFIQWFYPSQIGYYESMYGFVGLWAMIFALSITSVICLEPILKDLKKKEKKKESFNIFLMIFLSQLFTWLIIINIFKDSFLSGYMDIVPLIIGLIVLFILILNQNIIFYKKPKKRR
ncbi:MAG: hypothetical protein WC867_00675 [Candidatus Pacearchaeota archaeon]|jgi:hypothetical protein